MRKLAYALYTLAAALLLLGLLRGRLDAAGRNRIPLPIRMLSSALVFAAALALARGNRRSRPIAAGMGCGFLGDLVMARVIPLPDHVIFGMLIFGAGHTLYLRAFMQMAGRQDWRSAGARLPALGGGWAAALAGWWLLARNPALKRALNYGALAYALLLGTMSGLAASLAAQERRRAPIALGAALFLASDTLLAGELFRGTRFPQIGDVIWLTYIAGQALIVGGAGLAD